MDGFGVHTFSSQGRCREVCQVPLAH
jgi:hypothetical protein